MGISAGHKAQEEKRREKERLDPRVVSSYASREIKGKERNMPGWNIEETRPTVLPFLTAHPNDRIWSHHLHLHLRARTLSSSMEMKRRWTRSLNYHSGET